MIMIVSPATASYPASGAARRQSAGASCDGLRLGAVPTCRVEKERAPESSRLTMRILFSRRRQQAEANFRFGLSQLWDK